MRCIFCSTKEGRNLSGLNNLKSHVSVCLYGTGAYINFLPPKQGQDCVKIEDIEEYGKRFRYKCPMSDCDKSSPKAKPMGYKEFSIHCGSYHGILERWAQQSSVQGAQELYKQLLSGREEAGQALPPVPDYHVEEVHTCLLCHGEGEGGKEARALSFAPDKIQSTRYHYSSCLYENGDGVYFKKYKSVNVPDNVESDGITPKDVLGKVYKFTCERCPTSSRIRRKMGYKEFVTHQANNHGGLEEVLSEHHDEKVRALLPKMRIVK